MSGVTHFFRRAAAGGAPPKVAVAGFGKHPAWSEHVRDLGVVSPTLSELRGLLYDEGIEKLLAQWEGLPPEALCPFDHWLVWWRPGQLVLARILASVDRVGRAEFPFVVAADVSGCELAPGLRCLAPALEDFARGVHALTRPEAVREAFAGGAVALDEALAETQAPADYGPTPDERLALVAQPGLEAEGPGLARLLYKVADAWAGLAPLRSGKAPKVEESAVAVRVPATPGEWIAAVLLWETFLAERVHPEIPRLFLAPAASPWLDLVVGRVEGSHFLGLGANPKKVVLETTIPYPVTAELRAAAGTLLAKWRPRAAFQPATHSAPPPLLAPPAPPIEAVSPAVPAVPEPAPARVDPPEPPVATAPASPVARAPEPVPLEPVNRPPSPLESGAESAEGSGAEAVPPPDRFLSAPPIGQPARPARRPAGETESARLRREESEPTLARDRPTGSSLRWVLLPAGGLMLAILAAGGWWMSRSVETGQTGATARARATAAPTQLASTAATTTTAATTAATTATAAVASSAKPDSGTVASAKPPNKDPLAAVLGQADQALSEGQHAEALRQYRAALALAPGDARASNSIWRLTWIPNLRLSGPTSAVAGLTLEGKVEVAEVGPVTPPLPWKVEAEDHFSAGRFSFDPASKAWRWNTASNRAATGWAQFRAAGPTATSDWQRFELTARWPAAASFADWPTQPLRLVGLKGAATNLMFRLNTPPGSPAAGAELVPNPALELWQAELLRGAEAGSWSLSLTHPGREVISLIEVVASTVEGAATNRVSHGLALCAVLPPPVIVKTPDPKSPGPATNSSVIASTPPRDPPAKAATGSPPSPLAVTNAASAFLRDFAWVPWTHGQSWPGQAERGFWVCRHQTSWGEYGELMHDELSRGYRGLPELPVSNMLPTNAEDYCRRLETKWKEQMPSGWLPAGWHFGLPSQEEWYAYTDGGKVCAGAILSPVEGPMLTNAGPVTAGATNRWGVYQAVGNVFEMSALIAPGSDKRQELGLDFKKPANLPVGGAVVGMDRGGQPKRGFRVVLKGGGSAP